MPTYSYACTECGNRFDAVQAFTDDALTTCDRCSGRLRKLFGSVGVVFKGSGFYRTDSRDTSKASLNGSGTGQGKPDAAGTTSPGSDSGSGDKSASTAKPAPAAKTTSSTGSAVGAAAPS